MFSSAVRKIDYTDKVSTLESEKKRHHNIFTGQVKANLPTILLSKLHRIGKGYG
jgi:hypothetical protein